MTTETLNRSLHSDAPNPVINSMVSKKSHPEIKYGLTEVTLVDRIRENWHGYILILPLFLAFSAMFYYPGLRGLILTFHEVNVGSPDVYLGIDNYLWMITNDLFIYSFGWTMIFSLTTTLLQIGMGIFAALVLNEIRRGLREWSSALIVAPFFSAPVAAGVIMAWFLNPQFGFITRLLEQMGHQGIYWLSEGILPLISLIIAQTWHDFGFSAVVYTAAIAGIPTEQYEAAAMSGASRFRRFRDITLPHLITPTIILLAIRSARNIAEFAQPFELTGGGPGTRSMLMSILLYNVAYVESSLGRAFTIGIVMMAISIFVTAFYIIMINEEDELYV